MHKEILQNIAQINPEGNSIRVFYDFPDLDTNGQPSHLFPANATLDSICSWGAGYVATIEANRLEAEANAKLLADQLEL